MADKRKFDASKIKEARTVEDQAIISVETGQGVATQKTASKEEQAERMANLKTQGRKGCQAPRFNFRTTPENFSFITVMAGVTGRSVTGYLNYVIDEYRKNHTELYERAREIMDDAGMEDITQ